MKPLRRDIVYGLRMLLKSPGFTWAAVVSLALGIGANTTMFTLVNALLLESVPYPEPDRLVMVWSVPPQHPENTQGATVPDYFAWKEQSRSFDRLGAMNWTSRDFGSEENGVPAERIAGQMFTAEMFYVLGVRPILGRVYTPEEDKIDAHAPVMVISHRLWQRRYAGDPNIIQKTLRVEGVKTAIVGVMPPDFSFFDETPDFWVPPDISHEQLQGSAHYLQVTAHLAPGVSIRQAQEEMGAIAARLAAANPARNREWGATVQPLHDAIFGWMSKPLLTLQGIVGFVLLIACANVAGLLLARGSARQVEIAIRAALGASRRRIVAQFLTESVLLAVAGGILGVVLARWGLRALLVISPAWFPRLHHIAINGRVLGFAAGVSVLTGLIFGIVPALRASKPDLVDSLKASGRAGMSALGHHRLRSGLVTVQIALALVLLIGAGLMIRSFRRIQGNDLGYDPHGLLTFQFRMPTNQYTKRIGSYNGFPLLEVSPVPAMVLGQAYQRIQAIPGVQSAAGIS